MLKSTGFDYYPLDRPMKRILSVFVLLLFAGIPWSSCAHGADDVLQEESNWAIADRAMVIQKLQSGLTEQGMDEPQVTALLASFEKALGQPETDPMDAFIATAVSAFPVLGEKLAQIEASPIITAEDPFLAFAAPLRDQARLWAGRALVRARLFDEAIPLIESLEPFDVVAPSELLFYRGVCYHALLKKDLAIDDLSMLLEQKDQIPRRFSRTAELMLADIEPLKEDSLDEIARLMSDVSRRLDLGRSGDPVVDREQQIIDKLDKMIDKMEEQQKQQQQQMQQAQSGSSGGSQSKPMKDSQIAGGSGPGDVDRKDLGDRDGWGNLPPAQRQEALQKISQDLPTHYREAIEAYFRKLATEKK